MFKSRSEYVAVLENMYKEVFSSLELNWNYHPWPIIHIQTGYLFHLIFNGKKFENNLLNQRLPKYRRYGFQLKDILYFFTSLFKVFFLKKKLTGTLINQTLLVGKYKEAKPFESSKAYNIYLHPLQEELEKQSKRSEVLLLGYQKTKQFSDYLYLYKNLHRINKFIVQFKAIYKKDKLTAYSNSLLLYNFLSKHNLPCAAKAFDTVYFRLIENEIEYQSFLHFLRIVQPKTIWTYCYYDNTYMALIRAGNQLKINTVEYQHSTQSDDHFAYTKWSNIDLYSSLFPNTFWLWKQSDLERIKRNFWSNHYNPKLEVGGNLHLAHERDKAVKNIQHFNNEKKAVLICLQGMWIPSFIEDTIAETENYIWYFRLHPRYPDDKEKLAKLKSIFPDKIEVDLANQLSLYELFTHVSYNITSFSGTALEAQAFNVQNIIFGKEGKHTYDQLIKNDVFFFVNSNSELQKILECQRKLNLDYDKILVDRNEISDTINGIF